MKRLGYLWDSIVTFDNLLLAYRKARRGKRSRDEVALFALNLEKELFQIQEALLNQTYQPGTYRLFILYERKPRQISAAPFRDRVVHHALMNVVEPLLDKRFIADSYACRQGKGVHLAVQQYQQWAKRYAYTLKLDVARYFPSVDHAILKQQIAQHIKDPQVLWLFDTILDHSPPFPPAPLVYFPGDDLFTPVERRTGIPIGNLTSQFLANLYLDGLDHFIKQELRADAYLRYVDDAILLSNSKPQLHAWQQAITGYLERLRLRVHPAKANIFTVYEGVDVLGYRVFPGFRQLRNDNGHRFTRKLRGFARAYAQGRMDWEDFNPSVQSWIGHASHADTLGLRRRIFGTTVFKREGG
ncbi:reverse transcriptase domain-containing protein [Thiothrix lacustris]|uniref:reverse transcriptase domain-containing protein n=1 Tax=Thiothrix lacustris TaxID=525917 RepID=UPI0027E535C8|nr:reverse transcriptase domain-containing protein [Thiothrix lacustris]WMP17279.1 reverse transcriptase domain-containing protein [Thiothrix lacustris]